MTDNLSLQALLLAVEAMRAQIQALAVRVTLLEEMAPDEDEPDDPNQYMNGKPIG